MKAKIIEFKCQSPFFELTRDGKKPFDFQLINPKDSRFRALSQWRWNSSTWKGNRIWAIRLVHPSGQSICRELLDIGYVPSNIFPPITNWLILYLGGEVK